MSSLTGKHLVIFGCGYVGSALACAAVQRGLRVTALTRNAGRARSLRELGVEVLEHDLASDAWHAALSGPVDFVVNTVSAADSSPEGYRRSYVDGLRSILAWLERAPQRVETFAYTSSTGVYPQGGGVEIDETASTANASVTGRILVEAENLLRAAPRALVARTFVLRLAGIYGPGRHYLLNALRAGTTEFSGAPETHMNLIHRDDVVAALLACLDAPAQVEGGIFNLSDGAPATKRELLEWLAGEVGAPTPTFLPGGAGSARKGGEPTPDRIIRADRVRRVLGWAPRHADFRAGYRAIFSGEAERG